MEQHKFVWVFNMNRVGKIEMKDNGITIVKVSDDISVTHDSNLQNEISLTISDKKYIIPTDEEVNAIVELIKSKSVDSLQKYADSNLTSVK